LFWVKKADEDVAMAEKVQCLPGHGSSGMQFDVASQVLSLAIVLATKQGVYTSLQFKRRQDERGHTTTLVKLG